MACEVGRGSLEQATLCIDTILHKGAEVLYDHYLVDRLPGHATKEHTTLVQEIVSAETKLAKQSQPIRGDSQPCKITKDNLAMKSMQIHRMPLSAKLEPRGSDTPASKVPIKKKYSSISNRLTNLSKPKESMRSDVQSVQLIRLDDHVPTEEQTLALRVEECMRKRKHEQWIQSVSEKQKENTSKKEQHDHLKKLAHEFEEIDKKHHRYTYDFQGRILNCGPVNAKTQLFSRSLYPQIRIKIDDDGKPKEKQHAKSVKKHHQTMNARTSTTKSETFHSIAFNSAHASKLTKPLRGNNLGSDYIRNEIFNNNNKRQMSNLNLIEICEGAKLTELDNLVVMASDRIEPVTRKQFLETASKMRFKSFFDSTQQNVQVADIDYEQQHCPEQQSDRKAGAATTKLPSSSMSGRTKPYTLREKDSIPTTAGRKPMTATETARRKSESLRPRTSTKQTWGRVVANEQMMELLFE